MCIRDRVVCSLASIGGLLTAMLCVFTCNGDRAQTIWKFSFSIYSERKCKLCLLPNLIWTYNVINIIILCDYYYIEIYNLNYKYDYNLHSLNLNII